MSESNDLNGQVPEIAANAVLQVSEEIPKGVYMIIMIVGGINPVFLAFRR